MLPAGDIIAQMQPAPQPSYWDGFARSFSMLGSPLSPTAEDVGFMQRAIAAAQGVEPLEALLLGDGRR